MSNITNHRVISAFPHCQAPRTILLAARAASLPAPAITPRT
ncbi:MAG: hypothetical protein NTW21_15460 [Verrucomicrobia bacterium]|nr:hypothetical protein [Verrucomicrobiota bacterium]